jgi:hypothetical protein
MASIDGLLDSICMFGTVGKTMPRRSCVGRRSPSAAYSQAGAK